MRIKELSKEFSDEFNNQKTFKERFDFIGKTADLPLKLGALITVIISSIFFLIPKSDKPHPPFIVDTSINHSVTASDRRISSFIYASRDYEIFGFDKFDNFKLAKDILQEFDLKRQEGNFLLRDALKKIEEAEKEIEDKKKIINEAKLREIEANQLIEFQRKKDEEAQKIALQFLIIAETERKKQDEVKKVAKEKREKEIDDKKKQDGLTKQKLDDEAKLEEERSFETYKAIKAQEEKEAKIIIDAEFKEALMNKPQEIAIPTKEKATSIIIPKPSHRVKIAVKRIKLPRSPKKRRDCFSRGGYDYCS